MSKATETIFSGTSVVIPMADVQHIQKHENGCISVITKHTRGDNRFEEQRWLNDIFLHKEEAEAFLRAWCDFRSEIDDVVREPHHDPAMEVKTQAPSDERKPRDKTVVIIRSLRAITNEPGELFIDMGNSVVALNAVEIRRLMNLCTLALRDTAMEVKAQEPSEEPDVESA